MKVSEAWLKEWVDTGLSGEELGHRLTMLGLEVDGIEPAATPLDGVVLGRVLEVGPHPDADRLSLCRVDIGAPEPLAIVCGATNVRADSVYPVATIGAVLPGGLKIRKSKIRGQASFGMLCSAVELGLAAEAEGLLTLDGAGEPGVSVSEALALDDRIIDIDLTPNRADCFSMLGIARDLAAGCGKPFEMPQFASQAASIDDEFPVRLDPAGACGRFCGRVIRRIDPAAVTPVWMTERLRRAGIRAIHPVVDVTNYVMLELGQPMHAYDLARLSGGIMVRPANAGETLVLLDDQPIELSDDMLVIADANGPIALAGIMGGGSTAVGIQTTDIFFESAWFAPGAIAGRARRLGLHTDASLRFERGVDPVAQGRAVERATALLLEIAGGEAGPLIEVRQESQLPDRVSVALRRAHLDRVLGCVVPDAEVAGILSSLGMAPSITDEGWVVTPPAARFDIEREVDLIEEVARLVGYDRIAASPGAAPVALGTVTETRITRAQAREALADRGYQEAITYSFGDGALAARICPGHEAIALSNPISSELGEMRPSLWPGLLKAANYNLSRQESRVRLFETGVRFSVQDNEIKEEEVLSGLVVGPLEPEQWDSPSRNADLFDIKSDLNTLVRLTGAPDEFEYRPAEHPALRPGRSAQLLRNGQVIGLVGELHPKLAAELDLPTAPVLFELSLESLLAARVPGFSGVSKYPAVRRDIAVIVDREVPVGALETAVRAAAGEVLRDLVVFDVYVGSNIETGSKSVALGLILQETSRTLTLDDADGIMRVVVGRLSDDFDAKIRE